jgi:hypothetical protein
MTLAEPGDWVAHYSTAEAVFEYILPSGELRMSPYRIMRDPFENKRLLITAGWRGHSRDDAAVDAVNRVVASINRFRDDVRVLSLTRDATVSQGPIGIFGCCWARPRMWEQYGDKHRGACLIFRRRALESALRADLHRLGLHYLGKVAYTPAGFAGSRARSIIDDRIFNDDTRRIATGHFIEEHKRDLFFLKTDDWATEFEYRAVLLKPEDEYAYVSYGDALAAVVVGERFPAWQLAGAHNACMDADAQLKQIAWRHGFPRLVNVAPRHHDPPPASATRAPDPKQPPARS